MENEAYIIASSGGFFFQCFEVHFTRHVKKTMLTIQLIKRSVLMNTNYLQAGRVSGRQKKSWIDWIESYPHWFDKDSLLTTF